MMENDPHPLVIDTKRECVIDINPPWVESGDPTRININPGETADFGVLSAFSEQGPEIDTQIRFPSENGWENKETIEYRDFVNGSTVPRTHESEKISRQSFEDLNWNVRKIEITGENIQKQTAEVKTIWNGSLPELYIDS